jgi:hypothetical protein
MASRVLSHERGHDSFSYNNPECGVGCPGTSYNDDGKGRYYMEACPAALTSDNEWSYDLEQQHILLRLPGGIDPSTTSLHGKVASWAIVLHDCTNVTLKGLRFFATTIGMFQSASTHAGTGEPLGGNAVVECTFDYSTSSLRPRGVVAQLRPDLLLGYTAWSEWYPEGNSLVAIPGGAPMFFVCQQLKDCETNTRIINNVVRHTDSPAFVLIRGNGDLIENNVLEHIDHAAMGKCAQSSILHTVFDGSHSPYSPTDLGLH